MGSSSFLGGQSPSSETRGRGEGSPCINPRELAKGQRPHWSAQLGPLRESARTGEAPEKGQRPCVRRPPTFQGGGVPTPQEQGFA